MRPSPAHFRLSSVTVRPDSISIRGGKSRWTYTLDEAQQGKVALRLQLGNADPSCAAAPAKLSGNPPSSAKNDRLDHFVGAPKTPTCPPTP